MIAKRNMISTSVLFLVLLLSALPLAASLYAKDSIYNYSLTMIDGKKKSLKEYKGKVLLIVNTASQCGYTGQYEDLEKLYKEYGSKGLTILGVPSNSFKQEYSEEKKVADFCKFKYGVTFPLSKITSVTGPDQDPLFNFLTQSSEEGPVKWNFEKFLVDRTGNVVARYRSAISPSDKTIKSKIASLLANK